MERSKFEVIEAKVQHRMGEEGWEAFTCKRVLAVFHASDYSTAGDAYAAARAFAKANWISSVEGEVFVR